MSDKTRAVEEITVYVRKGTNVKVVTTDRLPAERDIVIEADDKLRPSVRLTNAGVVRFIDMVA